jgi:hypothetical protein
MMYEVHKPSYSTGVGDHCTIAACRKAEDGMAALRECFPTGEPDKMNVVLFSTSGVHGTYTTIEDVEKNLSADEEVTWLHLQPRKVTIRYGTCILAGIRSLVAERDALRKLVREAYLQGALDQSHRCGLAGSKQGLERFLEKHGEH